MKVALVCDYLEESWPSMDLVADMLYLHLSREGSGRFSVTQMRPPMKLRFHHRNADRLWNRFYEYPRWLRASKDEYDIFHLADHSYSQLLHTLPPERTIVHCHDLDTFRCLLEPGAEPRPAWFRWMTGRILEGFRRAAHVITVSAAIRNQVLHHKLVPADRVTVVANGVHPSCSAEPDPRADAEAERLLAASGRPLLLHVGSVIPRKRIDVLLEVFAAVRRRRPEVKLIRVGGPFTPEQEAQAGSLMSEIAVLPFLDRDVLAAVYRKASLLLLTSDAEGFGLPVIEAMACGCPVIASDIEVLREVGGQAAVYCRVADTEAWTKAVLRLLEERSDTALCLKQASRYSWTEAARQILPIYQHVAGAHG